MSRPYSQATDSACLTPRRLREGALGIHKMQAENGLYRISSRGRELANNPSQFFSTQPSACGQYRSGFEEPKG